MQRGDDDVVVVVIDVGESGLGGALWMWGGGVGEGVKGTVKSSVARNFYGTNAMR